MYGHDVINLVQQLKANSPESIAKLHYSNTIKIEDTDEEFTANLLWEANKVILFLNDSYEDFLLAQKAGLRSGAPQLVFGS